MAGVQVTQEAAERRTKEREKKKKKTKERQTSYFATTLSLCTTKVSHHTFPSPPADQFPSLTYTETGSVIIDTPPPLPPSFLPSFYF